jgi:hypothetical protein
LTGNLPSVASKAAEMVRLRAALDKPADGVDMP